MSQDEKRFVQVQLRAHQLFLGRPANSCGNAESDWFRAEEELRENDKEHLGPAKASEEVRSQGVTDGQGRDLENPS